MVTTLNAMDHALVKQAEDEAAQQAIEGAEAAQKKVRLAEPQVGNQLPLPVVQPALGTPGRFAHWNILRLSEDPESRAVYLKLLEEHPEKLVEPDNQACGWTWLHGLMDDENIEYLVPLLQKMDDRFSEWEALQNTIGMPNPWDTFGADRADAYGDTPLHVACARGQVRCVQALLKSGVNIDSGNKRKEMPLLFAAFYERRELYELLIQEGARQFLDVDGCAPEMLWSLRQAGDCAASVTTGNGDPGNFNMLHILAAKNLVKLFENRYEDGHNLDVVTRFSGFFDTYVPGMTALHIAAREGHDQFVQALLARNARKDCLDSKGNSALKLAAKNGHVGCVQLLLPSEQELRESKALLKAAHSLAYKAARKGDLSTVRLLFDRVEDKQAMARAILKGAARPCGIYLEYSRDPWNIDLLRTYYPHYVVGVRGQTVALLIENQTVKVPREFVESSASLNAIMESRDSVESRRHGIEIRHEAFEAFPLPNGVTREVWKKIELFIPAIVDYYYIKNVFGELFRAGRRERR